LEGQREHSRGRKDIKRKTVNMNTNIRIMAPCFVALSLGLGSAARAGDPASDPLPFHDKEIGSANTSSEGMPAKFNRASGIIGMDVRNQADKRLGRIKDVVFDLNTERVSYAVISTRPKGVFSLSERLLAVPVNVLKASADGQHLILNAEKSQVATAMGFDRNHWPSVNNPSWGAEPFWQEKTSASEESEPSVDEPMGVDNPDDMELEKSASEQQSAKMNAAPSVSPALDKSPGGLAWPGY
jgi:sporulation protein YlmC with PRC-barrel domain